MSNQELDSDLQPLTGRGGPVGQSMTMNERLALTIQALRNLEKTTISSTEKSVGAIGNLQETIKSLDRKNGKLQLVGIALTVATVFLAIVQVWTALHQPPQTVVVKETQSKLK